MSNIAYVNAVRGQLAAEVASDKLEDAKGRAGTAHTNQKELQQFIKKQTARIEELNEKLKEANDTNAWDDICNFFSGGNKEAGELGDKIATAGAELKYQSEQLKVEMKKLESAMNDGLEAQQEYAQSLQQHRVDAEGPTQIPA